MKTCKKCNKEFPELMTIEGKRIRFYKRTLCHECFPFKSKKETIQKICKKCGENFSCYIKIDNVEKVLKGRSLCFKCQPFNSYKKNSLASIEATGMKICSKCNKEKPINNFSRQTKNIKGCSYCITCANIHNKEKRRSLKEQYVDYKGGQCLICGYNKYLGSLDFHHIDPNEKEFSMAQFKLRSFDQVKSELDKCVLLCANCHREVHAGITSLPEGVL